ncbi:MAG: tryptophan--tRNA ligase [Bacteroidales bacterium]|jgi:tryptophanyl-tRNA synthetase|nr:tryptophan--tRNA ligase [Bacteroidales bacterium]
MSKQVVLSGIRPTGNLHLGNYFGAVRNFVAMQDNYRCYFFIADIHSLTTHPTPENLHGSVRQVLAEYLACGIDPDKAAIYIQSDLTETLELYTYLNMNAYLGELERTTSFKDKARKNPDNVNAGLLTYPVLMAADIIIHRANYVPVGKDQEQNLEMAVKFAARFNRMYGAELFPKPGPFTYDGKDPIKVPGLDGSGKMGKSEGNAINLIDTPEDIRKKVMRAVTDSGPTTPNQQKPEPIQNLFTLMNIVSKSDVIAFFDDKYNNCRIRYGDMKKQLAEDIIAFTAPIRERIVSILADEAFMARVAREGAEKARESASATMKEVRKLIGIRRFF